MAEATKYHPEVRFKIFLEFIFLFALFFTKESRNGCSIINGLIRECQAIKFSQQLGRYIIMFRIQRQKRGCYRIGAERGYVTPGGGDRTS